LKKARGRDHGAHCDPSMIAGTDVFVYKVAS